MRKNLEIIETRDYYRFKRLEGNRDVKCVQKIIDSINNVGYIMNPIIVNEKMEVIDGQNRLRALEELDLPVHYYIVKGANINTARALNLGRTNWRPVDYVNSFAEQGNKSYQMLMELYNKYSLSIQEIIGVIVNRIATGGWSPSIVVEGKFKMTEADFKRADETLKVIEELKPIIKEIKGHRRTIVSGIAWCMNVNGVNKNRLIQVFTTKYPLIKPVVEPEMFLRDITEIYNKSLAKEKKIDFDVIYRNQ